MSYFQIVDPSRATFTGGYTAKNAAEVKNGLLVMSDTSNALTLAGTADKPDGIAFSNRLLVPNALRTLETLDAAEATAVVTGKVQILVDADFFYGGVLPSVNDTIYSYTGGLMRPGSGTNKIGKCIKTSDYRTPPNTTTNVVLLDLELGGYFTV